MRSSGSGSVSDWRMRKVPSPPPSPESGMVLTPPAASTPGIRLTRASTSSRARTFSRLLVESSANGRGTLMTSARDVRKPGSTCMSRRKLLPNKPAPTSSTSVAAICVITSALRIPSRDTPPGERPAWVSAVRTSAADARHAATIPMSTADTTASASAKNSTDQRMPMSPARGRSPGTSARSARTLADAATTPSTPPATASTSDSATDCLTSTPRVAPSARRIASSPRRAAVRATWRFTTLAHAIASNTREAPRSSRSAGFTDPTIWSWSGVTLASTMSVWSPTSARICRAMARTSARAASAVELPRTRAMTLQLCAVRLGSRPSSSRGVQSATPSG